MNHLLAVTQEYQWLFELGSTGAVVFTVIIFVKFLKEKDNRFNEIADGLRETLKENNSLIKENCKALGMVYSKLNGKDHSDD